MSEKLLVTTRTSYAKQATRATGVEVLAEYANSLLVRATEEQAEALRAAGLETLPVETPPVQTASARYDFEDAKDADRDAPVATDDKRTAYYLVQLVGPMKPEWLQAIAGLGGTPRATLPGYRLIVGMLPGAIEGLREAPFVEDVTSYRPSMKVSPHLRPDVAGQGLDSSTLRDVGELGVTGEPEQVQITVFEGESTEEVAAVVRDADGVVLAMDAHTVVATVPPEALRRLADQQGIQAIMPFDFPTLACDRAAAVMNVPANRTFGGITLTGEGQVVGVVDSGLDTGNEATVHPDLRDRVTIVSSPNQAPALSVDPPPYDDGPADASSHGTHVAGCIAGNGAAAAAAGSSVRPIGIAPAARLHFTAVAQRVNWGPAAPPTWKPWGTYGLPEPDPTPLFDAAYASGARIHSNSWSNQNTKNKPDVEGSYDRKARAADEYAFTHRDALVLFAAGNNGRDANGDGEIEGDSIGPPATAKNVLTVGACQNDRPGGSTPTPGIDGSWNDPERFQGRFTTVDYGHVSGNPDGMALFSSRGPTDDGRIKPEVVAPGTNVLSVRTQVFAPATFGADDDAEPLWGDLPVSDLLAGKYCWGGGTSVSCPLVAGAAALVRQYLVDYRGHQQDGVAPSGALLKAYLVNGAVPMSGGGVPSGTNNVNGFGRVDVSMTLTHGALGLTAFSDDPALALAALQARTFTAQVAEPGQALRVTLCWTDPPNPVGGAGLQNQLYLRVRPPGGAPVDGDVTAFPTATNPTQRVVIVNPVAGTYEIQVHCRSINARSAAVGAPTGFVQDFAVVASNVTELTVAAGPT